MLFLKIYFFISMFILVFILAAINTWTFTWNEGSTPPKKSMFKKLTGVLYAGMSCFIPVYRILILIGLLFGSEQVKRKVKEQYPGLHIS